MVMECADCGATDGIGGAGSVAACDVAGDVCAWEVGVQVVGGVVAGVAGDGATTLKMVGWVGERVRTG